MTLTSVTELLGERPRLSVGILTADLLHLGDDLEALEGTGVSMVHVDVMDGVFCPMTTFGPPMVAALPNLFIKDVHLMVDDPLAKLEPYLAAGAGIITVHVESTRHPHRVLQQLEGSGVVRGVALNPGTPVSAVEPLLDVLELVLLLGVNPGWSGQAMVASTPRRTREARELIGDRPVVLGVDGGVTAANVGELVAENVDVVVAGSAVFDGRDAHANAQSMVRRLGGDRNLEVATDSVR